MTLILEYPQELEADLVAYWHRAGLLQAERKPSDARDHTRYIDADLSHFRLPDALQTHLHDLLDRQDAGDVLPSGERLEAESLVELAEFLSLLHLRALRTATPT